MILVHNSAWTFDTSAGAGAGFGIYVASGGMVRLKDPAGAPVTFHFGGVGAGLSLPSIKIPRLGSIKLPSFGAAGSTADFRSYGAVFRKSLFGHKELTASDFHGACIYIEGGGGLIQGASFDIMFFGASASLASAMTASVVLAPAAGASLVASSNGILVWGGENVGVQAGAGIGALLGAMF